MPPLRGVPSAFLLPIGCRFFDFLSGLVAASPAAAPDVGDPDASFDARCFGGLPDGFGLLGGLSPLSSGATRKEKRNSSGSWSTSSSARPRAFGEPPSAAGSEGAAADGSLEAAASSCSGEDILWQQALRAYGSALQQAREQRFSRRGRKKRDLELDLWAKQFGEACFGNKSHRRPFSRGLAHGARGPSHLEDWLSGWDTLLLTCRSHPLASRY